MVVAKGDTHQLPHELTRALLGDVTGSNRKSATISLSAKMPNDTLGSHIWTLEKFTCASCWRHSHYERRRSLLSNHVFIFFPQDFKCEQNNTQMDLEM